MNVTSGGEDDDLKQVISSLLGSMPFILSVAITGCISGGIVFSLYFISQVCEGRGMDVATTFTIATTVFITAPAPGVASSRRPR